MATQDERHPKRRKLAPEEAFGLHDASVMLKNNDKKSVSLGQTAEFIEVGDGTYEEAINITIRTDIGLDISNQTDMQRVHGQVDVSITWPLRALIVYMVDFWTHVTETTADQTRRHVDMRKSLLDNILQLYTRFVTESNTLRLAFFSELRLPEPEKWKKWIRLGKEQFEEDDFTVYGRFLKQHHTELQKSIQDIVWQMFQIKVGESGVLKLDEKAYEKWSNFVMQCFNIQHHVVNPGQWDEATLLAFLSSQLNATYTDASETTQQGQNMWTRKLMNFVGMSRQAHQLQIGKQLGEVLLKKIHGVMKVAQGHLRFLQDVQKVEAQRMVTECQAMIKEVGTIVQQRDHFCWDTYKLLTKLARFQAMADRWLD